MIKPDKEDVAWMTVGAVILLLILLVVFHFYQKQNPAE
jgi:hypothetical protein